VGSREWAKEGVAVLVPSLITLAVLTVLLCGLATSTTLSETVPSAKTQRWAVRAGMPSHAPASKLTSSGRPTARASGTAAYSAAVPKGLPL
jgi:hypothetical protein